MERMQGLKFLQNLHHAWNVRVVNKMKTSINLVVVSTDNFLATKL